ncbi:hypothetical protein HPB50_012170 [Hyalomma asiaticum]|uniref:Uncharacterized protein n=1 Tax=Hyalomma asiaticum TaxID=266040 RepID=A0ACB7RZL5_HYAAI|nr:hypothetical protein HPB50_012170 [Hyalomma asiaticum]
MYFTWFQAHIGRLEGRNCCNTNEDTFDRVSLLTASQIHPHRVRAHPTRGKDSAITYHDITSHQKGAG